MYDHTRREFGPVARRQLVCGLHVHVAVPGADRAVAVHNGLRERLPELAALGANGAFLGGGDTGMASVRPLLSGLLPRQGVPPALSSLEAYAEALRWGVAAGAMPSAAQWWWELRLHVEHGTVEVRVPDAQAAVADAAAIARRRPRPRGPPRRDRAARTRPPRPTPGASRRTAGRRPGTASRASSPTSSPPSGSRPASACWRCSTSWVPPRAASAARRSSRAPGPSWPSTAPLRQRRVAAGGGGAAAVAADLAGRFLEG